MNVFELFAKIDADTSGFEEGINKAKAFGTNVLGGIGKVAKVGAGAIAGVGVAVTATTGAIVKATGGVAEYGDNIDKMSQKMGISAKGYQEWEAVMQHSGTSMETMKASMKTLANAVESGNDAFSRIGLSMEDIANMSNEDIFNATIAGLQNVENETERTYLAGQLLGRGATELGALLNTSAADTQAMKDRVNELGGVMSDKAVKAAAAYQDQLQDMKTAFSGLTRGMTSEFLPSITTVMDGLTDLFSGDETGIKKINAGFSDFVGGMTEALPQLLTTGSQIVNSLLGAISENLPQLIDAGVQGIAIIAQGFIDNAPSLVSAVGEIGSQLATTVYNGVEAAAKATENVDFTSSINTALDKIDELFNGEKTQKFIENGVTVVSNLAKGIGDAAPDVIPKAAQIVTDFANGITDNIPQLLEAGGKLVVGLGEGLLKAAPQLFLSIVTIRLKIIGYVLEAGKEALDKAVSAAKNLISQVAAVLPQLPEKIAYYAGYAITRFKTEIDLLPVRLGEAIANALKKLIEWGKEFTQKGKEIPEDFIKQFFEKLDGMKDRIWEKAKAIGEAFVNGIKGVLDGAGNLFDSFASGASKGKEDAERNVLKAGYRRQSYVTETGMLDENGFSTTETGINYDKLANAIVRAFIAADIKIECDDREVGRLIRKVVTA